MKRTWKLSTKFYASYKSSINYQKNSIIKDKIKTNVHFENVYSKWIKKILQIKSHKVKTKRREGIKMVQHF